MLALTVLLSLWTAWLLFSLFFLARTAGIVLAAGFLALWFLLVFATSLSWRNYLMIWLCVPIAITAGQVMAGDRAQLRPRLAVAAGSAAGLVWLWLAGGAAHAQYVVAAILGLLAAVLFGGLGFIICWLYFYGPAQRAQKSAEARHQTTERRAAEADRRTAQTAADLEEARRAWQNLKTENARLRAQPDTRPPTAPPSWGRPPPRPAWPATPPPAAQPVPGSLPGDDRAGSGAPPGAPTATIALVRVTCFALRGERAGRDPTGPGPGPAQPVTGFQIKRETVVMSNVAPHIEALRHEYEQPGTGHQRRKAIKEAIADYAAQRIQGTVLVSLWQTREGFPIADAAGFLDGSAGWLRGLVAEPLSGLGSGVGLPGPVAAAGAGIAANLVTAPVTTPLDDAARICDVTGIVFGVLTGMHPLVITCVKQLARDAIGQGLAEGFERIMTFPAAPGPAATRPDVVELSRELRGNRPGPADGPRQGPTQGSHFGPSL
jgi:hypothetical protein